MSEMDETWVETEGAILYRKRLIAMREQALSELVGAARGSEDATVRGKAMVHWALDMAITQMKVKDGS